MAIWLVWLSSNALASINVVALRRGGSKGGAGGPRPPSEIFDPPVAPHLRKFSAKVISLDAFVDEFDARHQNRKLALH